MSLPFVPFDAPASDFLVVTSSGDSKTLRQLLQSIGAEAVEGDGFVLYLWSPRLLPRFISGFGVLDNRFEFGPKRFADNVQSFGAGYYNFVEFSTAEVTITSDPFGMAPVFYSDELVTNRLHLAALVKREIDPKNAASVLFNTGGFSFNLNTFKTPVVGVKSIPVRCVVSVDVRGVHLDVADDEDEFQELDPADYHKLIEAGAAELVDNVSAFIDSGFYPVADLSGGRDSRMVFGAIIAAGRVGEVKFHTSPNPTTPGLQKDLEIATGLVDYYGGSYQGMPRAIGYSSNSLSDNLKRRRSQVFGTYHWLLPADVQPVLGYTDLKVLKIVGGGGELYRDYFQPNHFFEEVPSETPYSAELLKANLEKQADVTLGIKLLPLFLNDLIETFESLPGHTIGQKLDAHYLNFRHRYSFGIRQTLPENQWSISPLLSLNLLKASRGLPARERRSGRVIHDVLRVFDEKLAYFRYDSPDDPQIFESKYHLPSQYDGEVLPVQSRPDLVEQGRRYRPLHPIRPQTPDWNFEELLVSEIDSAFSALQSTQDFNFLLSRESEEFIKWVKARSPRNRSALASKLRFFADLTEV